MKREIIEMTLGLAFFTTGVFLSHTYSEANIILLMIFEFMQLVGITYFAIPIYFLLNFREEKEAEEFSREIENAFKSNSKEPFSDFIPSDEEQIGEEYWADHPDGGDE